MNRSRRGHIGLAQIVRMAVANLLYKKFRSFITLLGITIGIGAIYLLLSFGMGLQDLVQGQVVNNKTINTIDVSSINSKIVSLTPETIKQVKAINHVVDVSGIYSLASRVTVGRSNADAVVYGVDATYLELTDLALEQGKMLDPMSSDHIVVNDSLLRLIGIENAKDALDKEISVTITLSSETSIERMMTIAGVVNSGDVGAEVYLSKQIIDKVGESDYSAIKVVVDSRESIPEVRAQIENLGYSTASPIDTIEQINQVFRFFNLVLVSLGSIGMVIAALGMINTLTVSLLERTREISLMMILGARRKDIRAMFTTEAIILSLLGGTIGILLAIATGTIINLVLNRLATDRGVSEAFSVFAVSPILIISVLALMVLIGLIVSYLPARRASKINPVQALREE